MDCAPLAQCPGDPTGFAEDAPSGATVVFVRPTGAPGLGTREAPYGSLAEALRGAGARGTWVLGPGDFTETLALDGTADLTIVGACPTRTRIAPLEGPALRTFGGQVRLERLTLAPSTGRAIEALRTTLRLSSVEARTSADQGVVVTEGELEIVDSVVRADGLAVSVDAARAHVADAHLEGDSGIVCERGGGLWVERSTAVAPEDHAEIGSGVLSLGCATSTITHVRVAGHPSIGVGAVPVNHAVLEDVAVGPGTRIGIRLGAEEDLPVDAGRQAAAVSSVYVEGASGAGLLFTAAVGALDRVFAVRTGEGVKIETRDGFRTSVTIDQILVLDPSDTALKVTSTRGSTMRTRADVSNLYCMRTSPTADPTQACISVDDSSQLTLSLGQVGPGFATGLFTSSSAVVAHHLTIEGTTGPGIHLRSVGDVDLNEVLVEDAASVGLLAEGTSAKITTSNLTLRGGLIGLQLETPSTFSFAGLRVDGAETGILVEQVAEIDAEGFVRALEDGVLYRDPKVLEALLPGLRIEAPRPLGKLN